MAMEQQNRQMEMQFNASTKAADREQKEKDSQRNFAISLDGSVADQVTKSAKEQGNSLGQLGQALAKAAETNAKALEKVSNSMAAAGDAMAQSAQAITKAATAKKRLIRDPKTGRAMGVESE
jgi:hypothetical protein